VRIRVCGEVHSVRVLVIGSGAREHALGWKLKQSPLLESLHFAPGNAGAAALGENVPIQSDDVHALAAWASRNRIDLTVVGPENPLVAGIAAVFAEKNLPLLGPSREGALLEGSKAIAKAFCSRHGIPTAAAAIFDDALEARAYARDRAPLVIKADGLALGKGVAVCRTPAEALDAIDAFMVRGAVGEAGKKILVESFLEGEEVSAFALLDGKSFCYLGEARDYKRAGDGDSGPNTGGMGSVSAPGLVSAELRDEICRTVFAPAVEGMKKESIEYKGILFAGMMLTKAGPRVLEFNARLGDPETQVLLPRVDADLLSLFASAANGNLSAASVPLKNAAAVGAVIAAEGYPGKYEKGNPLPDLGNFPGEILLFHAATSTAGGRFRNESGRTLTAVALGGTVDEARNALYRALDGRRWEKFFYRKDIGAGFSLSPARPS